jgi:signal transduction histidine kinase
MSLPRAVLPPKSWLRRPRPTARLRLTLSYGALFLASGGGLLAITNLLVRHATAGFYSYTAKHGAHVFVGPASSHGPVQTYQSGIPGLTPPQLQAQANQLKTLAISQRANELHQLAVYSWVALAIMAALSIALGWIVAGRVLRPLRIINATARRLSASNLHERLAATGPDDEFKELSATLDDLLNRLEASFESQRRFVANASHELRTPLAAERTLLQVALADPDATTDTLRTTCEKLLRTSHQQERLIDALLTLASSERGLDRWEPFDLAAITESVVTTRRPDAQRKGVHIQKNLAPAVASGDAHLATSLVTNLVDNAVRHNIAGGQVEITTTATAGRATISVSNTGPVILPADVDRLLQPFQRLARQRTHHTPGHGLGLAIVQAIATTHRADLDVRPRHTGGLDVHVSFPPPTGSRVTGQNATLPALR